MTGLNCSMMAFSEPGQLLCDAKHLGMSAVAGKASADGDQKRLVHSIDWKPLLSLLTEQQLSEHCRSNNKDDETSEIEYCISLEDAIRARLQRILPQLQGLVEPGTPTHLKRFVMWIERQLRQTPGKAADEVKTESIVEEEIVKEEVEEKPAPVVEKKVEKKDQPDYHKVRS